MCHLVASLELIDYSGYIIRNSKHNVEKSYSTEFRVKTYTEWSNSKYPRSFSLSFGIGSKNARICRICFSGGHLLTYAFYLLGGVTDVTTPKFK